MRYVFFLLFPMMQHLKKGYVRHPPPVCTEIHQCIDLLVNTMLTAKTMAKKSGKVPMMRTHCDHFSAKTMQRHTRPVRIAKLFRCTMCGQSCRCKDDHAFHFVSLDKHFRASLSTVFATRYQMQPRVTRTGNKTKRFKVESSDA